MAAAISPKHLEKVKTLYYEQKLSARQIAEKFGVCLDAVYYFMRHHGLKRRSVSENDAIRFAAKEPSFALATVMTPELEKLKVMAVMLYWAEGSKRAPYNIDFANSDPAMIAIFTSFLRRICGVGESKLRACIYCYANQNVLELTDFWSELTSIPKNQFTKPYIRQDFDIRKKDRMRYGLLHIRYCDKKLMTLLLQWIAEYATIAQPSEEVT